MVLRKVKKNNAPRHLTRPAKGELVPDALWRLKPLTVALCLCGAGSAGVQAKDYFDPSFLGDGSTQVDLSAYESAGSTPEGSYLIDIYMNQQMSTTRQVRFVKDGKDDKGEVVPELTPEMLRGMGVAIDRIPAFKGLPDDKPVGDLKKLIPDATVTFNMAKLRLDLTVPQVDMDAAIAGQVDPKLWDEGVPAALFSYNMSGSRNWMDGSNGSPSSTSQNLFGSANGGLNLGPWRLRTSGTVSQSQNDSGSNHYSQTDSQLNDTYVQRDVQRLKGYLTMGESSSGGAIFDSVPFRGASLISTDDMTPNSQRGFAPVITGTAKSNARVTVEQNGSVIYETNVPPGPFSLTDIYNAGIRGYYRNIRKETLMQQVRQHVISPVLRDLVHQYLHYTVEDGGTFQTPEKGISRGCPLSPLMGALHLHDMDAHFSRQQGIHYARYMDDVIILATSRWSLRKQTKQLMQWFSEYGFEAHPDKTFIGRTEKGFDWMGAWLTHEGVTDIAPRAKANHREKVRRLYERLARVPFWKRKRAQKQVNARVSAYRLRWNIWAAGVLCTSLHVPAATLFVDPTTPTGSTLAEWQLPAVSQESPVTNGGRGPDPVHGQNQGSSSLRVYATIAGTLVSPFAPGRQNVPGTPYYGYPIGGPQSRYWMVFSMTTGNAAFYTGTIRNDVTDGERTCTGTLSDATGSSTYGVPSWNVTGGGAKTQPNITYECAYYGNPVQGVTMQASCNPDNTCNNAAGLVRPHISLPGITARIVYTQQGTTTSVSGTGGSWAISWAQTAGNQRYGTNDTQYITAGIAAIATTGVTCAISSSGGPPTPISTIIHSTSPSTANTIAASGTVGPLSVNCSGASDPGSPVINVGYQIKPSAGTLPYLTRADAVQSPTDTGYYLTLHTDAPSCTNNSKSVRLDGTTVSLGSIPPGGSGSIYSDVNPLNYALCSTGAVSSLGSHTISLLATSVMY